MKKLVRNLFAVIAATALVGSLASCADSDAEDPFATTSTNANSAGGNGGAGNGGGDNGNQGAQGAGQAKYTNNEITFPVTVASTNAEKTVLLVKYDRTAAGKAELIKVTNAGLKVWKNGALIKTIDTIEFALDDYGASFSGATGQISDENDMKEYKVKLSIGDTVAVGDTIKVKLDEKAFIEAIGKDAANVNPESVVVALVDIDPSVNYYKELCENSDLYKPFLTKKEENTQQGGGGTGGQQPTDGTGTDGQQPGGNGGNGGAATVVKTLNLTVNHYDNADHGIQYTEDMSAIPVDAKSGDVWTLKIAGTADAEFRGDMQFVNASWAGITGESISKTFTTTAFSYEIDFTFSADCSDGKFMLGNAGLDPAVAKTLKLTEYSFTKKSSGAPSQNSGNSNVVYSGTNVTLTIPVNTYNGSSNNQLYKSISEMGITNFSPAAGEKYTIYMKGTSTGGKDNINAMNVGFTCNYSWDNCAMDGGFNISSDSIAAGVSKEVTFKGEINASTLSFWLYNESTANESDFEEVTLTLSEFKITKVTE